MAQGRTGPLEVSRVGQHNGRRGGVELPEHEEARQQQERMREVVRDRVRAEFTAQVQRVAGQVASGLVDHRASYDPNVVAADALAIARAVVVRSMSVPFPTADEVKEQVEARGNAHLETDRT